MKEVKILEIKQSVFADNDRQAELLREELRQKGIFLLNLMSSTGAGKTTTLTRTIEALRDEVSIGVGDMADYLVKTNRGHYIIYEKVLEILQRAEDNGFVHQITNIDGENKIFAVCGGLQ